MPTYRYTGAYPKHLHGLTHGVNAHHQPADGSEASPGTVTASLGDHVTTADPYEHPDLKELEDAIADVKAASELGVEAAAELAAALEQDHQRMTAEGAPAPTEQE